MLFFIRCLYHMMCFLSLSWPLFPLFKVSSVNVWFLNYLQIIRCIPCFCHFCHLVAKCGRLQHVKSFWRTHLFCSRWAQWNKSCLFPNKSGLSMSPSESLYLKYHEIFESAQKVLNIQPERKKGFPSSFSRLSALFQRAESSSASAEVNSKIDTDLGFCACCTYYK